jgi:hypothetical protein
MMVEGGGRGRGMGGGGDIMAKNVVFLSLCSSIHGGMT